MPRLTDIKGSKSFHALNPDLHLASLPPAKPEQRRPEGADSGLVQDETGVAQGPRTGPSFRVTIICLCHKKIDSDNLAYAAKHLRDLVAATMNPDASARERDSDDVFEWEVLQAKTSGEAGVIVMVEELTEKESGI